MSDYERLIREVEETTQSIINPLKLITISEKKKELGRVEPLIYYILDEDFEKFIELYEISATEFDNPYDVSYFDNRKIIQKCMYELIKDNSKYQEIEEKLLPKYEKELNRSLERNGYSNDMYYNYQAPYSEMREYSLVLADMCFRQIKKSYDEGIKSGNFIVPHSALTTYENIKTDMNKAGIEMDSKYEEIINKMLLQENIKKQEIRNLEERKKLDEKNKLENKKQQLQSKIDLIDKLIENDQDLYSALYFTYRQAYTQYAKLKSDIIKHEQNYPQVKNLELNKEKLSKEIDYYDEILQQIDSFYNLCNKIIAEKAAAKKEEQEKSEQIKKELIEFPQKISECRAKINQILIDINSLFNSIDKLIQENSNLELEIKNYYSKHSEYLQLRNRFKAVKYDTNKDYTNGTYKELSSQYTGVLYTIQTYQEIKSKLEQFYNECNQIIGKKESESKENESQIRAQDQQQKNNDLKEEPPKKEKLVSNIIEAVFKADELSGAGLNISKEEIKNDAEAIKRDLITARGKLMDKDIKVLEYILSRYTPQKDNTIQQLQTKSIISGTQQNTNNSMVETYEKSKIIADIIEGMLNADEFPPCGTDMSKRLDDIDYAKRKLEDKSIEELKRILSIYTKQDEENITTGMKI